MRRHIESARVCVQLSALELRLAWLWLGPVLIAVSSSIYACKCELMIMHDTALQLACSQLAIAWSNVTHVQRSHCQWLLHACMHAREECLRTEFPAIQYYYSFSHMYSSITIGWNARMNEIRCYLLTFCHHYFNYYYPSLPHDCVTSCLSLLGTQRE